MNSNDIRTGHDDHVDEGLAADMERLLGFAAPPQRLMGRRQLILGVAGGAGALALFGACASDSSSTASPTSSSASSTSTSSTSTSTSTSRAAGDVTDTSGTGSSGTSIGSDTEIAADAEIPDETAGPFPGDGTNGPNALADSGVVRNDIRTGFGSSSGTAAGVETALNLTIVAAATGEPIPGAAVYLWHCDRDGRYSMYDIESENYLRGVQVADADGNLSFTSIFPGCYPGRWPHAHFEVYSSIDEATVGTQAVKTSQLAYPEAACNEAYAAAGYETSVQNLTRSTLASDNVFRDGVDEQMATVSGSPDAGYTASLVVRI